MDDQPVLTGRKAPAARPRRSVTGALLTWGRSAGGAGWLAKGVAVAAVVAAAGYATTRGGTGNEPIQVVEAGRTVALPEAIVVEVLVTATLPDGEPRVERIPGDDAPAGVPAPGPDPSASPAEANGLSVSTRTDTTRVYASTSAGPAPSRPGDASSATNPDTPPYEPVGDLTLAPKALVNTKYAVLNVGVRQVVTGPAADQRTVTMGPLLPWGRYPVQQWTILPFSGAVFTLAMGDHTRCLSGTSPVTVAPCDANDGRQQWELVVYSGNDPAPVLKNLGSGKCLTARAGSGPQLAGCSGADEQRWRMGYVPGR